MPTYWGQRYGTVRLAGGRLSFTEADGTVRFDVPVAECHSLARAELGTAFEVWHGSTRHRVVMTGSAPAVVPPAVVDDGILGAAIGVGAVVEGVQLQKQMTGGAKAWAAMLAHDGGQARGVRVHKPFGSFRYVLTSIMVVVGITAAIVAAVWVFMAP